MLDTAKPVAASYPRPPKVGPSLPFIGNALSMLKDPLGFSTEVRDRFGPIARVSLGPKTMILLQGADGIRQILWEKGDQYPKPELGMATLEPLLGKSVATLTDTGQWEEARRFVLPLFTAKMLKAYFAEAVSSIQKEVDAISVYADTGESIDMYRFMHEATFRVLVRTIFRMGLSEAEISEFITLFDEVTDYINVRYVTLGLPVTWAIPAARRGKRALDSLDERVFGLIRERRRAAPAEGGTADMLDVLLAAETPDGRRLSDKEIRDNCMTMLFGGHETTAGSLTWAWGLLAANTDKRQLMLNNIDEALKGQCPADYAGLGSLNVVNNVFAEAMRLYPMFSFLFRQATAEDVVEGHRIEPGDLIAFSAYTVQHTDSLWSDPEKFIPERHEPDAFSRQHKSSYLPFSQGKRGCIGERMARMEGILMLTLISQKYELDLADDNLPKPSVRMSIKPVGGMKMYVRKRRLQPTR